MATLRETPGMIEIGRIRLYDDQLGESAVPDCMRWLGWIEDADGKVLYWISPDWSLWICREDDERSPEAEREK